MSKKIKKIEIKLIKSPIGYNVKKKNTLEALWQSGKAPWKNWE